MMIITGRLPTLPHSCPCSTIGAEELNYRVRDGNGWVLLAKVTQKLVTIAPAASARSAEANIDGHCKGKEIAFVLEPKHSGQDLSQLRDRS